MDAAERWCGAAPDNPLDQRSYSTLTHLTEEDASTL